VCDDAGRPVLLLLTEGKMSDHRGAAMMLPALPPARELLADRGYDSNRFRAALASRGIEPCIPSTKSRKLPLPYDKLLYRQRHRIENMFGRIKDCVASQHATIAAQTPSSQRSASQPPSLSGSRSES
jgi:transposase